MKLFDGSRRLIGANLYFGCPAVVLEPQGPLANDHVAHAHWAMQVERVCAALGWPAPRPIVRLRDYGGGQLVALAFAAPQAALYTATEINEWAWARGVAQAMAAAAAEAGSTTTTMATIATIATPATPATPATATMATTKDAVGGGCAGECEAANEGLDEAAAIAVFAARAAREASGPLRRLEVAARRHGVACFDDDDTVSLGAGSGSRSWPRAALPLPMDVPWRRLHDVPTVLVTGSNGKTTTTRLLAAIAAAAGRTPGWCSTEGVFAAGRALAAGDYAGPAGARLVLRDGAVRAALLETARGGLLRRGLAVRRADVAVVTNVGADHLGEYGIASADDIAEAKLIVAHAVADGGTLVLNAGDAVLMRMADRLPHAARARRALFAADHDHPLLAALRERCNAGAGVPRRSAGVSARVLADQGGEPDREPLAAGLAPAGRPSADASQVATCGVHAGRLLLWAAGAAHDLGEVAAMPLSVGGAAVYNVENLAAAALAAHAAGFAIDSIAATLARFGADADDNPGRLERWPYRGATVLVDYAHNPDGLTQLLRVARALQLRRLGLLLGQAGNRDDAAIRELARVAAGFSPDRVVIKELPDMRRGRAASEVSDLLEAELRATGLAPQERLREPDEEAAARLLLEWAQPGDVVVLPLHTAAVRDKVVAALRAELC